MIASNLNTPVKSPPALLKAFALVMAASYSLILWGQEVEAGPDNVAVQIDSDNESEDSVNQELVATIASYELALESLDGTYDQATQEVYLDLANAHSEFGDYDKANTVYRDALQALRISSGLYCQSQLGILESSTINSIRNEDWEQVDNNFHLRLHVARNVYERDSPDYIAGCLASCQEAL